MLIVPLDAAVEATKQAAPQVFVTLQQPPGMSEWVKIVISAAVGAVLGIGSNILMEFFKPAIALRQTKKRIRSHLAAETLDALQDIWSCRRICGDINNARQMELAKGYVTSKLGSIVREKYEFFAKDDWVATNEIDRGGTLRNFHKYLQTLQDGIGENKDSFDFLLMQVQGLLQVGRLALEDLGESVPLQWPHSFEEDRCQREIDAAGKHLSSRGENPGHNLN